MNVILEQETRVAEVRFIPQPAVLFLTYSATPTHGNISTAIRVKSK